MYRLWSLRALTLPPLLQERLPPPVAFDQLGGYRSASPPATRCSGRASALTLSPTFFSCHATGKMPPLSHRDSVIPPPVPRWGEATLWATGRGAAPRGNEAGVCLLAHPVRPFGRRHLGR